MNDFDALVITLGKISHTTKLNEKLKYLETLKENDIAKDFFKMCLDPMYQFGCKRLPDYDLRNAPDRPSSYHFVELAYTRLLENKKGIQGFIESILVTLTPEEYYLFTCICKKDPSIGVSAALVNKIWPRLIDTGVKLCKAEPYSAKSIKAIKYPCYVQKKEDGARCLCFYDVNSSSIKFLSSSGKQYHKLNEIQYELEQTIWHKLKNTDRFKEILSENDGFVIDGELIVYDENDNIMPRQEGNGILNKSIKNTISDNEANQIKFIVWDFIPFNEYYCQSNKKLPYNERLNLLKNLTGFTNRIKLVDTSYANNLSDIIHKFKERILNNEEGIIVKNVLFFWDGKRIKDQIKFKVIFDITLKVTGWKYGAKGTKYENVLGALECASQDEKLRVSVGSGLSDDFRKSFVNKYKSNTVENLFAEIRSNGLITQKNDANEEYSLFLPRFVEIRDDKTEADDFDMITKLYEAKLKLQ